MDVAPLDDQERSLLDLYDDWRRLEWRIGDRARQSGAPEDQRALDEMTEAQVLLLHQIAKTPAASISDLLLKMSVWSRSAPDVSPDCEDRQACDILAYSVYEDLGALAGRS